MEVTYGEFERALSRLQFQKETGKRFHVFSNKKFDASVMIPATVSATDKVFRLHFASTSDYLETKGVIPHKHDLAKLIEQERLGQRQEALA